MSTYFLQHRTVRFGECDPAGVVYYPVFFNWFHECMEDWFDNGLKEPYAQVIKEIGFPAKSCAAEFFRPIHNGSQITLVLSISEIRPKGITLQFEIFAEHISEQSLDIRLLEEDTDSNKPLKKLAVGKVVCVGIGVKKGEFHFRPMPIPSELYQKMLSYLHAS